MINFVTIIRYVKRKLQKASAGCIDQNGAGTKSRAALAGGGDFILLPFEK